MDTSKHIVKAYDAERKQLRFLIGETGDKTGDKTAESIYYIETGKI